MKSIIDITIPFVGTILLIRYSSGPWLRPLVERASFAETIINCGRDVLYLNGHLGRWRH